MEQWLTNVGIGFGVALTPENILFCFIGAVLGTVIGVLPGVGPITAIAILLPVTYGMNPITAMIMLCGIFYGGSYGGSTTSILINTPGEASSIVTCLDGHPMARQGRAKAALATAAIGSFFGGTVATAILMLVAPFLAALAIRFGPPEYFSLIVLSLTMVSGLSAGSPLKGFMATIAGIFLALVGIDPQVGAHRFTFGLPELMDGFDFVAVAMGLFGVSEVLEAAGSFKTAKTEILKLKGAVWISLQDLKDSFPAYLRGTAIGFVLGSLPGAGGTASSFISYLVERKVAKHPERFGQGAIEGVAGPETANNAAHQAAMVPLLTMGIPPSAVTALLLGALMMYGLQPGPLLYEKNPQLVWGLFASMYVANVILLVLNLPLVNVFARLLDLPGSILYSMVLALCVLGVYATRMSMFDVGVMLIFGVIGYYMRIHKYPLAPMLLGMVLGELMEQSFRRALILTNGDPLVFFTRPISAALLAMAVLVIVVPQIRAARHRGRPSAIPVEVDPDADAKG